MKTSFIKAITVTLIMFWCVLTATRLLLTTTYVNFAYRFLSLPQTTQANIDTRDQLAPQVIKYLTTDQSVPSCFTQNEQSHLQDVKKNVAATVNIHAILTVLVISWIIVSLQTRKLLFAQHILNSVSKITEIGFVAVAIVTVVAWSWFFTTFHQLFFPQGNWAFPEDSLLIQLFPESFWIFTTIILGILTIVLSWFLKYILNVVQSSHEIEKREHRSDL